MDVLRRLLRIGEADRDLVASDAAELITAFGEDAYATARARALAARRGEIVDGNRSAGHWDRVRAEIGRCTHREHVDTATRYLDD